MASRFWVGGTGTWDASTTTNWAATTGGAGGQTVPGSGDTVTFDGSSGGGVVTVNTNFNVTSVTMGAFTGTLDFSANNNSPTMQTWLVTGAGTRTLNLGSGTFTLTGTAGTIYDASTVTGLTLNAGTSTILVSAVPTASRGILLGAKTYNNVTVTNASPNGFSIDFANGGAFTVVNLTLTNVRAARLSSGTTHTITGTFTYNGASNAPGLLYTNSNVATLSLSGANSLDWIVVQNITKSGAGSLAITNGYDGLGNTSITITNPSGGASSARMIGG